MVLERLSQRRQNPRRIVKDCDGLLADCDAAIGFLQAQIEDQNANLQRHQARLEQVEAFANHAGWDAQEQAALERGDRATANRIRQRRESQLDNRTEIERRLNVVRSQLDYFNADLADLQDRRAQIWRKRESIRRSKKYLDWEKVFNTNYEWNCIKIGVASGR